MVLARIVRTAAELWPDWTMVGSPLATTFATHVHTQMQSVCNKLLTDYQYFEADF